MLFVKISLLMGIVYGRVLFLISKNYVRAAHIVAYRFSHSTGLVISGGYKHDAALNQERVKPPLRGGFQPGGAEAEPLRRGGSTGETT